MFPLAPMPTPDSPGPWTAEPLIAVSRLGTHTPEDSMGLPGTAAAIATVDEESGIVLELDNGRRAPADNARVSGVGVRRGDESGTEPGVAEDSGNPVADAIVTGEEGAIVAMVARATGDGGM